MGKKLTEPETFAQKISREQINKLPIRRYAGNIELVRAPEQVLPIVTILRREPVLGFDTETRPAFRKGQSYKPALLQLATSDRVYIFQLKRTGLPEPLCDVLGSPCIIKAGVAVRDDIRKLKEIAEFVDRGFVDLGEAASKAGLDNHGLRGLAAAVLGFRISKQAQRTNWARNDLTQAQIAYAATDAWASRGIYLAFRKHQIIKP